MNFIKVGDIIDLCDYEDIDDDFKIMCRVRGELISLTLFEIDRASSFLILHDEDKDVDVIDRICKFCYLNKDNVCEYFNKKVNDEDYCSEWIFSE